MAWATAGNIITTNLDAAGKSPADARPNLKAALDELTIVSNNLGTTDGAAKIESTGVISSAVTGIGTTSGSQDFNITPGSKMVNITDFINLNPVAYASLPSSPSKGDIAFLTTDEDGDARNMLIVWNGTAWTYIHDNSAVVD